MKTILRVFSTLFLLLLGGVVGGGIALLFAPQSGRATRANLSSKGVRIAENIKEELGIARHQATHRINTISRDVRHKALALEGQLQEMVEEQGQAVKETIGVIPELFKSNGR